MTFFTRIRDWQLVLLFFVPAIASSILFFRSSNLLYFTVFSLYLPAMEIVLWYVDVSMQLLKRLDKSLGFESSFYRMAGMGFLVALMLCILTILSGDPSLAVFFGLICVVMLLYVNYGFSRLLTMVEVKRKVTFYEFGGYFLLLTLVPLPGIFVVQSSIFRLFNRAEN